MSLAKVLAPERLKLEAAYTEEEAHEEARASLADAARWIAGHGGQPCSPKCQIEGCGLRAAARVSQRASRLIEEYRGVTCG